MQSGPGSAACVAGAGSQTEGRESAFSEASSARGCGGRAPCLAAIPAPRASLGTSLCLPPSTQHNLHREGAPGHLRTEGGREGGSCLQCGCPVTMGMKCRILTPCTSPKDSPLLPHPHPNLQPL